MTRILSTAALVVALTAGSALANPSIAAQAWNKVVPSTAKSGWQIAGGVIAIGAAAYTVWHFARLAGAFATAGYKS